MVKKKQVQTEQDLIPGILKGFFLDIREGQKNHRELSCQRPHRFILPDFQVSEQRLLVVVQIGEKPVDHIDIQSFPEAAGTGDEGNIIIIVPPFSDEHGFINIKTISFYEFFKGLYADANGPGHFVHLHFIHGF